MRFQIQREWAGKTPCEGANWRKSAGAVLLVASLLGSGCLGAGGDVDDEALMRDPQARATRIEALRTAIDKDHRTLETLITQPGQAADASLHANPELRAIAVRLTEQERLLRELTSRVADEAAPPK